MTQLAPLFARKYLPLLLLGLLLGAARSARAVDMFLQVTTSGTTTIPGESVDKDHKNWIDVLAWSWGLDMPVTTSTSGGASTGKVNMRELTITKYLDKASPKLMLKCCQGGPLAKVELEVRRTGSTVKLVKITLENVLITSVQTGGSTGEDRLTETVTFTFQKVTVAYTPVDNTGAALADVTFTWDLATNTGS